jgi:hypothetical protein
VLSPVLDGKGLTLPSIRSRTSSMTATGSLACSLRGVPVAKQTASSHGERSIGRNGSVESCWPCQELGNRCAEKAPLREFWVIDVVLRSRRYSKEVCRRIQPWAWDDSGLRFPSDELWGLQSFWLLVFCHWGDFNLRAWSVAVTWGTSLPGLAGRVRCADSMMLFLVLPRWFSALCEEFFFNEHYYINCQ